MLVTILITNYNYGRFLREAIDSALNQTYLDIEVIVVDDGSTDDSRDIIASYGNKIIAVFKENGGLASAVNVGFAASRGAIICFLDSDDVFLPEKVACVVQAWKEHSHACLVYHQLQTVDAQKKNIGKPWPQAVWRGNIRKRVERSGGCWPNSSTTGLSFSRSYLERMMPVPTGPYLVWPDTYLASSAPFFGPIIGVNVPLALYRFHGQNSWALSHTDGQSELQCRTQILQRRLNQYVAEFNMLKEVLYKHLNTHSLISLDDHLAYQRHKRAVGESVSLVKIIMTAIKCPSLPASMKLREIVKIVFNRW